MKESIGQAIFSLGNILISRRKSKGRGYRYTYLSFACTMPALLSCINTAVLGEEAGESGEGGGGAGLFSSHSRSMGNTGESRNFPLVFSGRLVQHFTQLPERDLKVPSKITQSIDDEFRQLGHVHQVSRSLLCWFEGPADLKGRRGQ